MKEITIMCNEVAAVDTESRQRAKTIYAMCRAVTPQFYKHSREGCRQHSDSDGKHRPRVAGKDVRYGYQGISEDAFGKKHSVLRHKLHSNVLQQGMGDEQTERL